MSKYNKNPKRGKEKIKQSRAAQKSKTQSLQQNAFVKSVLDIFLHNPHYQFNTSQVANSLGVKDKAGKNLLYTILSKLEASGTLKVTGKERFTLNPKADNFHDNSIKITGIIDMKRTGKAYLIPDDGGEDVFIASTNVGQALDRDKVEVHLFPLRAGRKREGQVVKIIKRNRVNIVGVLKLSKKFAFVIPDDSSITTDIYIPLSAVNKGSDGDKVIVKITDWPSQSNSPFGEIVEILGKPGNNDVEMHSILASFDFPLKFSPEAEAEANLLPEVVTEAEIAKRRDCRGSITFTIDPIDAKDFDDALSVKTLDNGNFEVGIHIADVTHYVKPGTAIDEEAYNRGTSIYLVDRTIPMLPEKLSNNVCSLKPAEEKLCFSAIFEINGNAEIMSEWFGKTVIKSNKRFTYEEVQAVIEGEDSDLKNEITILNNLASILRKLRFTNGAIAFHSEEVKFVLDENGAPIDTYISEPKEANWLIEEFMLLANRRIAEKINSIRKRNKPPVFIYRIHDTPNPEKLETFALFVRKLGYKMNVGSRKSIATSFNNLFKEIAGKGEQNMIETIAIRTMAKALYSTHNIGHYGLAFKHYSHFTSPIRRYPDIMAHRLLERYLSGEESVRSDQYEPLCEHCSDMEKKATDAERASVKYKQAEYMLNQIGKVFTGIISGVSKWGIYVELEKSKCEGMIPITRLDDDLYFLDEDNYRIIGRKYKKIFRLGDKIEIVVKSIDLQKKQMSFDLHEL